MVDRELEAGRELDALVAEKVMGDPTPPQGYSRVKPVPPYSTDIAAAWEVVERLCEQHVMVSVGWDTVDGWACEIMPPVGMERTTTAPTAPLAICRAALSLVPASKGEAQ